MADIRERMEKRETTLLPSSIRKEDVTATSNISGPLVTAEGSASITQKISESSLPTAGVSQSETGSASSTKATSTSTAAATGNGPDMNVLIPAVATVGAVLLISFIGFWLLMRRRVKKAARNEPEFVMEGMKEKSQSRPVTSDSNSSTKELVPQKNKESFVAVKEVERPTRTSPSSRQAPQLPPPRLESALDCRPGSRQADAASGTKSIPNFSRGPRPSTRDGTASPAPAFGQRDRSASASGPHGPSSYNHGPRHPQSRTGSFSRPLGPPQPGSSRNVPAPSGPVAGRPSQDNNPFRQQPGAYNGASPISQYSPIIKDMPKFGTSPMATIPRAQSRAGNGSISSMNDTGTRKPPPAAIKTTTSPSMVSDPTFSEENMRIARLANNSRLGFHSMVATTAATSPATEEPPTPSPRLPPPATRDAPPTNYNVPLPAHEPPVPASIQARLNGASIIDRRSVVSGMSDDYVDVEVDNKSDVSSLDEREKWQLHDDNERVNSRQAGLGAYAGMSPRPPLLSNADASNSDSNASQYSLGYYGNAPNNGANAR